MASVNWASPGALGILKSLSQIASSTLSNSNTETTLVSTLANAQTMVIPANMLTAGLNIYVRATGIFSTSLATAAKLTLNFKIGSTALISCQTLNNLVASLTNKGWEFSGQATVRSIGSSGSLYSQGKLNHIDSIATISSLQGVASGNTATASIDTTVANTMDVTAQWSAADAGNSVTMTNMTVEVR